MQSRIRRRVWAVMCGSRSVSMVSRAGLLCGTVLLACLAQGLDAQSAAGVQAVPFVDGQITVIVKLAGDPVAVVRGRARGRRLGPDEAGTIAGELRGRQDALVPAIAARGGRVVSQMQHAINGLRVQGTPAQIAAIARLPGVVGIKRVQTYTLDNVRGVPFVGAPAVWGGLSGFHGEGIKVAVLDTGIDYTHATFGGPGTPAAFSAAATKSTGPADPAWFGPAAPKVKGGTDLVGDNYNASGTAAQQVPQPDSNPLDCNGHGSHVSGTLAGFGVLANGTTFHGPYDTTTFDHAFTVGPGVAPAADLYMVRVFGCAGSTNVVLDGIDWAVANDMQVISMSFGASFGSDSAEAEAATNAANAGIVVVAAAGNSGAVPYITGGPGVADKVVSVAAMDATASVPGATATTPGGQAVSLQNSNGAPFSSGTTLNVAVLRNADNTMSFGCDDAEYVGVAGKVVIALRGGPCSTRVARAISGQNHGASAVVLINNAAGFPPVEGPIPGVTIPFFGALPADAATLASSAVLTLTNSPLANPTFGTLASFTSMGPRSGDAHLKPDVTGPGVNIFSTLVGSGSGGAFLSGTSMATPHVAGVAALALQAHATWDPDDVRLSIVNTADPTPIIGYTPRLAGAGAVDALSATLTSVVAEGTDAAPNVSFGLAEFGTDFHDGRDITLRNLGAQTAAFNVTITPAAGESPHTATVTPAALQLTPGQTGVVHVDLTIPAATSGDATAFREVAGVVTLTPSTASDNNGIRLTVPYHTVPRARSAVTTAVAAGFGRSNPTASAHVTNASASVGGSADVYAWGLAGQHPDVGSFGLRAVGVKASGGFLFFAINTFKLWNQPFGEFDIIIDSNGDGFPDFDVFSELLSSGQVAAFIFNLHTNTTLPFGFLASSPTVDTSTLVLPVRMTDVGVTGRFTYSVESFDFDSAQSDALPGIAAFNAFSPAISAGLGVMLPPGGSADVPLAINPAEWMVTASRGLMVVSPDNFSGAPQAQLIAVPTGASPLQSIVVSPATSTLAAGHGQQFTAFGGYAYRTSNDLTASVTWSSSNAAVASVSASGLVTGHAPGGPVVITATQAGISGTGTLTVTQSTTITSRSANLPSTVFGQSVTFSATVAQAVPDGSTPTGSVTFLDGATSLGTASLAGGSANVSTSALTAGAHTITVQYSGDADDTPSTSAPMSFTVSEDTTTTAVVATPTPTVFGQTATVTATVSVVAPGAGTPTGSVTFLDGATALATVPLTGGSASASTSALAPGIHTISVQYSGDADDTPSTSAPCRSP